MAIISSMSAGCVKRDLQCVKRDLLCVKRDQPSRWRSFPRCLRDQRLRLRAASLFAASLFSCVEYIYILVHITHTHTHTHTLTHTHTHTLTHTPTHPHTHTPTHPHTSAEVGHSETERSVASGPQIRTNWPTNWRDSQVDSRCPLRDESLVFF